MLLNKIAISEVFQNNNTLLSQPIILSLLQQLSADIGTETQKKFDWIQECCASLDFQHPIISRFSEQVIAHLIIQLESWVEKTIKEDRHNPAILTAKILIRFASTRK